MLVGEAWIKKNGRGTQTQISVVVMLTASEGRRIIAYVRKAMEEEV